MPATGQHAGLPTRSSALHIQAGSSFKFVFGMKTMQELADRLPCGGSGKYCPDAGCKVSNT